MAHGMLTLPLGHHSRQQWVIFSGTRTPMLEYAIGGLKEALGTDIEGVFKVVSSMVPLRRFAMPHEISGICSFLASDDSTFMTGAALLVDGGAAIVDVSRAALSNAGVKRGE